MAAAAIRRGDCFTGPGLYECTARRGNAAMELLSGTLIDFGDGRCQLEQVSQRRMTARKGQCFADAGRKRRAGDPPFRFSQRPHYPGGAPVYRIRRRDCRCLLCLAVHAGRRQFDSDDREIRRRFPCLEEYAAHLGRALSGLVFKPGMWERRIGIAWAGAVSIASLPPAIRMPRCGLWRLKCRGLRRLLSASFISGGAVPEWMR